MPITEVWMRGPVDGFAPLLQPVAHSFLQVIEELDALAAKVDEADTWKRAGHAASIGFHIRHIAGSTDRLLTYARGESVTAEQIAFLKAEATPGTATLREEIEQTVRALRAALDRVRTTPPEQLLDGRKVGRAGYPSTTLGLFFHAAEHATRHAGQAITTALVLEQTGTGEPTIS